METDFFLFIYRRGGLSDLSLFTADGYAYERTETHYIRVIDNCCLIGKIMV